MSQLCESVFVHVCGGYNTLMVCRGRKVYEPPRYMTINQATEQLLEVIANRRQLGKDISKSSTPPSSSQIISLPIRPMNGTAGLQV